MKNSLAATLTAALVLAIAPQALAATTLYSTPSPTAGADCSAATPCGLGAAIEKAASGDTVSVGAGTYDKESSYYDEGRSITIAGAVIGAGRPVVRGILDLEGPGSQVSDLAIEAETFLDTLDLTNGASADRVLATNTEGDGCDTSGQGTSIANSVCLSANPTTSNSGLASQGSAGVMAARNTTLIGYYGFFSNSGGSETDPSLTLANSVAQTTQPANEGVDARFNSGLTTAINSYFGTKNPIGGTVAETNQLAEAPTYRGPGDYREAAGSPTIDAGSDAEATGTLDLNGNLRKIGAHTDIGAYEFVEQPPSPASLPASPIGAAAATVNGTVDTHGGATSYHLEYGPSAAYGTSTPVQLQTGSTGATPVHFDLAGLTPKTTVHFKIVASNEAGTTATPDGTFETAGSGPAAAAKLSPSLRLKGGTGGPPKGQPLLDRSSFKLLVGCGSLACEVTVKGKVTIGAKSYGKLTLPKKATSVGAGKQSTIVVRSSGALRTRVGGYLTAHPSARAKLRFTAGFTGADGSRTTKSLTVAVRPPGN